MKIKKGDKVLIIAGKWKGKVGKVLKNFSKEKKVLVEGVNLVKKHQRPRRMGEKGQIVLIPKPIDVSNVKLICPNCERATRVGFKIEGKEKFRICKKCHSPIK